MEYLSPEIQKALLVCGHAVDRYTQRVGVLKDHAEIVEHLKALARTHNVVTGKDGRSYIRVLNEKKPMWLVLQGRIIKTILTHRQYLSNCERGIV